MMTNIYDPGVRTKQYILKGHQMMDMYFGMQGQNNNKFWRHRNNIIAEFVHYVMGYHTRGVAFDPEMPGWKAYQQAFNTTDPGWQGNRYGPGQSTTKEISKVIRHGIQTFGGKLIFEAQQVYGDNIFSWNGSPRDTDIEAQDLFQYVQRGTQSPQVKYGDKGTLEFQWGGEPTVLSRAHFLTNWKYSGTATHSRANQDGGNRWDWIGFVENAMGTVVFEIVRLCLGCSRCIVNSNNIKLIKTSSKQQATNAAKTINTNANFTSHRYLLNLYY